jgi:hypothetical protein
VTTRGCERTALTLVLKSEVGLSLRHASSYKRRIKEENKHGRATTGYVSGNGKFRQTPQLTMTQVLSAVAARRQRQSAANSTQPPSLSTEHPLKPSPHDDHDAFTAHGSGSDDTSQRRQVRNPQADRPGRELLQGHNKVVVKPSHSLQVYVSNFLTILVPVETNQRRRRPVC